MKLKRGLLVSEYDQRETEALGDNTGQFSDKDIGKAVAYNGVQMDLCAGGAEIAGFTESVEPYTDGGHSLGTVKKSGRVRAEVGAGEAGTLSVGDLVVADAQTALGTAGIAKVKGGAPAIFKWMVVWVDGTGAAGDTVTLERV